MPNCRYKLILVPPASGRVRTVHLSAISVWTGIVSGSLALLFALGVVAHSAWLYSATSEVRRLDSENATLRAAKAEHETATALLESRVRVLQQRVTQMGFRAGFEQTLPIGQEIGLGGVSGRDVISPRGSSLFRRMENQISRLTERSAQLELAFRSQKDLLDSTPSIWPVRGYVSAQFGNRLDPFSGEPDFHPGVDISDPYGTKVAAAADGIVLACGSNGGYGNNIVIDHGHDLTTRYAHLSGFNIKVGDHVRRGDVIGFVGTTGRSTGPHLHYEVWLKDRAQNPLHYIIEEYKSFD